MGKMDEVPKIWKDFSENHYNMDTLKQVTIQICGLDDVQRGNYFRGVLIRGNEVQTGVRKLNNGKAPWWWTGSGGCIIWSLKVEVS